MKKILITSLKIVLSIFALYIVYTKIDLEKTREVFVNINYFWLFIAFVFFTASRIIGAIRLNLYFSQIGLKLSQIFNLKLYYLGMFYNLFLPGGIGGDGYKIYFLHKHYNCGRRNLLKATFLDRLSGLFFILIFILLFLPFSSFASYVSIPSFIYWVAAFLIYIISYFFSQNYFSQFKEIFTQTSFLAFLLQFTQLVTIYFILNSMGEFPNTFNYLTIFLISSIVAVLPLSIGGIGIRELTFIYCLEFLNVDFNTGVALSIIFFIMTAFSSLIGMFYMSIKPNGSKC